VLEPRFSGFIVVPAVYPKVAILARVCLLRGKRCPNHEFFLMRAIDESRRCSRAPSAGRGEPRIALVESAGVVNLINEAEKIGGGILECLISLSDRRPRLSASS
jgi:hypothetical protein